MKRVLAVLLPLFSLGLFPLAASPQVGSAGPRILRGLVFDGTGAPVAAAIVRATGPGGESAVLTGPEGVFTLRLADDFAVEALTVDRIGYASRSFPAASLGPLQEIRLQVDTAPIELGAIVATAESQCRVGAPGSADAAAILWAEVKKSLEITALTQASRVLRFETETYQRDLRPSDHGVLRGTSTRRAVSAESPYRSISVAEMTQRGWFEGSRAAGWALYAPDAAVLLTEDFANQHCFTADLSADSVLLRFTPNEARRSFPEIEGTLVLDSATSELTELRFAYLGDPDIRQGAPGGEIRFFAAPNGLRAVREWAIRAPVLVMRRQGFGSLSVNNVTVSYVHEEGGRVVSLRAGDAAMELASEPLDLGPRDAVQSPEALADGRTASTRDVQGGAFTELVLRNDGAAPLHVTHVQLRECANLDVSCGDHAVDVTIPPSESRVLLQVGKEDVSDPFRFVWTYVGEDVAVVTDPAPIDAPSVDVAPASDGDVPLIAGATPEARERSTARRLLAADIPVGQYVSAFDLVTFMRPRWLRLRPIDRAGTPVQVQVYLDGVPLTPTQESSTEDALKTVQAAAIASIEYVDAATATIRWGTGHQQGAIVITSLGR